MITLVHLRRKFSKLMSYHFFRYCDIEIILSIVNLKFETNKVWQDRCGASLGLDGYNLGACFRSDDREACAVLIEVVIAIVVDFAYGTMFGPG